MRVASYIIIMLFLTSCSTGRDSQSAEIDFGKPVTIKKNSALDVAKKAFVNKGLHQLSQQKQESDIWQVGTGKLIELDQIKLNKVKAIKSEDGVHFNFFNTDIKEVVRTIFEDILNVSYTISSTISGTVTLKSSNPVSMESVLIILSDILGDYGVTINKNEGVYHIVNSDKAKSQAKIVQRDSGVYGVQIIPLKYIDAEEMLELAQPFANQQATSITVEPKRNLLIVRGSYQQRRAIEEATLVFDIDALAGMSFALLPVSSAEVGTIITELEEIFLKNTGSAVASRSRRSSSGSFQKDTVKKDGVIKFIPVKRLNSILVVTAQAAYLKRAKSWLKKLDRGNLSGSQGRLYVYYVQHGKASDLARVLKNMFSSNTKTSNSLDSLDEGSSTNIRITADSNNNALFILALPSEYTLIESAITHMDISPVQVLIEATIAEVSLNDELRFGVQWFVRDGSKEHSFSAGTSEVPTAIVPGFSYILSKDNITHVLNSLNSLTDVEVLSSPQIMVLDNKTATLQVGDQIPIATRSSVSADTAGAPVVSDITLKDTGIILRVTPRVNNSNIVTLEIEQEVSDVVNNVTSGIDSPTIQQRKFSSTIAIEDGKSIALGGLIRTTKEDGRSGIPFLSSIPLIGPWLFSQKTNTDRRTELIVLITPHILRDQQQAQAITYDLQKRLKKAVRAIQRQQ